MNKPLAVISCPIDTFSGYGSRSRIFVKQLIELKEEEWDIKIFSMPWGNCPFGFIEDNKKKWGFLDKYIIKDKPQHQKQPDIWFQISIPSEFHPLGKYNIGITAGIESTIAPSNWVDGINRMNLTLCSSKHSKNVFLNSKYEKINKQTGQKEGIIQVEKPLEVLGEGVDTNIFKYLPNPNISIADLDTIPNQFCFLFASQWVGNTIIGEDRKNVGLLIKSFYETFKNKPQAPALILKTSIVNSSYPQRDEIIKRIHDIKNIVIAKTYPKIYLINGEFTDEEMNEIYNHPKIKAMISLTKGEGYGRTLLEFTLSKKPLITTGWSGHLDFLNPEYTTLLNGKLTNIHPTAANDMLLKEAQWFSPDLREINHYMNDIYLNYKKYIGKGKQQGYYSKTNHNSEAIKDKLKEYLKLIPETAVQVPLNLPNLTKLPKLELPKLSK